ncbi:DUF2213 domain-containing protein [Leptolyngbya sp. FACHB-541]|uniref:DUF2213 domain-containing protein n=1 Tax=Leptolyngbya sp. FACHB-541 TaxID=2692810 RepID=UPI001686A728|nr:DUF2213 domain-containing protein [Leptolyngbya sp. FACHB-541]MBD1995304.1 DUF2213 domain-containing protein [Leptolyngbya sp. FACHB-541]
MVSTIEKPGKAWRFDYANAASKIVGSVEESDEGFLTLRGTATKTGVFPYRNRDGSTRHELRHPDDILQPGSLRSLGGKPGTNDHPTVLVNPRNSAEYSVGSVGTKIDVNTDGKEYLIDVVFNIHRQDAIADVVSGRKRQLSCGYTCDVAEESGVYNGQPYTHRQRNVVYNHLALVERARAGADARLHIDSADDDLDIAYQVYNADSDGCESFGSNVNTGTKNFSPSTRMAQITIDGVAYSEVPETVASVMAAKIQRLDSIEGTLSKLQESHGEAQGQLAELQSEVDELTAARDREQGRADGLEEELEDLRFEADQRTDGADGETRVDSAEFETRVVAEAQLRVDALDHARQLLSSLEIEADSIKLDASMSPAAIQKAVVVGLNPGTEVADDEVKGYYKALGNGKTRADGASTYHADMLEAAVGIAQKKGSGKKAPTEVSDGAKKRMDNCKSPLAMSKR